MKDQNFQLGRIVNVVLIVGVENSYFVLQNANYRKISLEVKKRFLVKSPKTLQTTS